jgi:hypothetical protein
MNRLEVPLRSELLAYFYPIIYPRLDLFAITPEIVS